MYFLTSILCVAECGFEPTIKSERCFGYFSDKQKALRAADENWADMHECSFNWLLIEKIPEGLHAISEEEIWYKWDDGINRWIHVEKPAWSDKIINWSIG